MNLKRLTALSAPSVSTQPPAAPKSAATTPTTTTVSCWQVPSIWTWWPLSLRTRKTSSASSPWASLVYVVVTVVLLLAFLIIAYPLVIALGAKLDPFTFIRKIANVAVFGFSTSSSAATLPLNIKVCEEEFGVDESIASFVLPLGMTINMDGTAIMQVIATVFIAGCAGYTVTPGQLVVVALLALLASVGTPAAPGAGAVILFTILSGMGFVNDGALLAYSLILAINRPIEMLVTSLNVVGDAVASICVAKSEGLLNEETFNK